MKQKRRLQQSHFTVPAGTVSRALGLWGLLLLIPLFFLPVLLVMAEAFRSGENGFTPAAFTALLASAYIRRVLLFSLYQAVISTLLALLIGLPGALIIARVPFRGRFLIRALSAIPFMLPSIIVVLGFVMFWGNSGVLNSLLEALTGEDISLGILYTFKAIILAHAFYNFPIVLSIVSSYLENMDTSQEVAAYTLGAKRLAVFRTITLPRVAPAIISSAALVFLFCFTSFAIVLVLGGGPKFTTIEVEIYRLARMALSTADAAALSIISISISSLVLIIYIRSQKRMRSFLVGTPGSYPLHQIVAGSGIHAVIMKLMLMLYVGLVAVFTLGPLLSIVVRSFQTRITRGGNLIPTLQWYSNLFTAHNAYNPATALKAIINSGIIAAGTVIIAVPAAIGISFSLRLIAQRKAVLPELVSMAPLAISSVIIGLGYFILAPLLNHPLTQWLVLICSHAVITLPFIIRAVLPSVQRIQPVYAKAALLLGARPNAVFLTIELPLIRKAIASGVVFALAISLGEIQSTLILSSESTLTIPILLYRLIGSYNFFSACALGVLLMILAIGLFSIVEYWRDKE